MPSGADATDEPVVEAPVIEPPVIAARASRVRLSSAVASSSQSQLLLVFTGDLDDESAMTAATYQVQVNGQTVEEESISALRRTVTLGLPESILRSGDIVTLTWADLLDAGGARVRGENIQIVVP